MKFRLALTLMALGAVCVPLRAQLNRGAISGLVRDPARAVIPGATIVAVHEETNLSRTTRTTESGNYLIPALDIGRYRIEADAPGFRHLVYTDIVVAPNANVRLDLSMVLASTEESVEVHAETIPIIESESARISTTISRPLVQNLPLVVGGQIRNVFNLAIIAPEVKTGSKFRIGGGQGSGYDMVMDGSSLTSASTTFQTERVPLSAASLDAISEFTVESTGMKAEYGRAEGVVNFVTKSGTNQLHGNAFDYLRNEEFDARGFFATSTPKLRQHDLGGTLGGPVRIPKLYNGRDKTFFFLSYEGFRNRQGSSPQFLTIPLPEMYNGDFRGWTNAAGARIPIYDPASTRPNASGGFIRDAFPDGQIPKSRFSTVAATYLGLRSQEMVVNRPGPRNNYFRQEGGLTNPLDKGSAKIDHRLTQKDQVSLLFSKGAREDIPLPSGPPGLPFPFNDARMIGWTNWSLRASWTRTFTPSIVNNFRFMHQRESGRTFNVTTNDGLGWGKKLGIKNTTPQDTTFPGLSFTEYSGWGGNNNGFDAGWNTSFANDTTIVRGKHVWKAGFFYQKDRWDGGGQHTSNGQFGFSQLATAIPGDQSRNSGNAFASFLLGYVSTARLETYRNVIQRFRYLGGFLQDDWRVTPNLTLNLGVRYEYTFPVRGGAEVPGQEPGFSNFDPTVPNPSAGGRPGGYIFSGKGPGRTGSDTMYPGWPYAVSPRVGVAWQVRPGTVVRTAGGRSFGVLKATGGSTHFDGFIGFLSWASADREINDVPTLLDKGLPPWPKPPDLRADVSNGQATVDYWMPSDAGRPTQFWNWSFGLQQRLSPNTLLEAGYIGTRGTHLLSGLLNINQIDPRYLRQYGPALLLSNINSAQARAAGIPVPYAGFQGTVQQALQPFPQFQTIRTWHAGGERAGSSSYHALRINVEKRYSGGLTLLGSYVLSKMFSDADAGEQVQDFALDQYSRRLEKSLSADDQTHIARLSFSYELPFGRHQKFAASNSFLNTLIGGWGIAAFLEYGSGTPVSVAPGANPPIYPGAGANRVTISSYDNWRAATQRDGFDPFKDLWWNRSAFQQAPAAVLDSTLGNATRRNPKARTPWSLSENVSLAKQFAVKERLDFTLRFEAFNVFNRVRWGGPVGTYTAGNFGQVRSQANSPRQMQLGLKVQF